MRKAWEQASCLNWTVDAVEHIRRVVKSWQK